MSLVAVAASAHDAAAQDSTGASGVAGRSIAIWGSAAIGTGQVSGTSDRPVIGMLQAHVAVRSLLLSYRGSDIGPVYQPGDGVREGAVLAGLRTGGHHLFGSIAVGYGRANHYRQGGENSGAEQVDPSVATLAYDVAGHANHGFAGVAVGVSGNAGPRPARYSAVTIAFELGWFGR